MQEAAVKTGSVDPLNRGDAADGPFPANSAGGGQGTVGFVARRDSIHQYTFLASRPGPLGLPSKLIYRRYKAPGVLSALPFWYDEVRWMK